jgi:hypothetical protein
LERAHSRPTPESEASRIVTDTLAAALGLTRWSLSRSRSDTYLFASNPHANYDVMPDGKHFVFLQGAKMGEMTAVLNWESVLRARTGAGGRGAGR